MHSDPCCLLARNTLAIHPASIKAGKEFIKQLSALMRFYYKGEAEYDYKDNGTNLPCPRRLNGFFDGSEYRPNTQELNFWMIQE